MKTNKLLFTVIAIIVFSASAQAQQSSNAAGGDATGSGGSVAYSVGQVVYTANNSPSGTVSQGVQQAYEIYSVGIKETELNISLSVFPNPIVENLILQISDYNNEKLSFQLYDIQGKLVNKGQIIAEQTQINTSSLPPATYFIHVVNQDNKKIQLFKIIKN
jgi:opacity protein-like surface antigen